MPYTVIRDWLIEHWACQDGLEWFDARCPSGEASVTPEFLRAAMTENLEWVGWLATRLLSGSKWTEYDMVRNKLRAEYCADRNKLWDEYRAACDKLYAERCADYELRAKYSAAHDKLYAEHCATRDKLHAAWHVARAEAAIHALCPAD